MSFEKRIKTLCGACLFFTFFNLKRAAQTLILFLLMSLKREDKFVVIFCFRSKRMSEKAAFKALKVISFSRIKEDLINKALIKKKGVPSIMRK